MNNDTPRYMKEVTTTEEGGDDFGDDNPEVDQNVEIDEVAPETTASIKFESVSEMYGKYTYYTNKKPVKCPAIFGTVLPTAFSINNGSAGMFSTVITN